MSTNPKDYVPDGIPNKEVYAIWEESLQEVERRIRLQPDHKRSKLEKLGLCNLLLANYRSWPIYKHRIDAYAGQMVRIGMEERYTACGSDLCATEYYGLEEAMLGVRLLQRRLV